MALIPTDQESVCNFSDFILSVFYVDDLRLVLHMPDLVIATHMIQNHLEQFSVQKSAGPDYMHTQLLNNFASIVFGLLASIFTKTLEKVEKSAKIKPIYKALNTSEPNFNRMQSHGTLRPR